METAEKAMTMDRVRVPFNFEVNKMIEEFETLKKEKFPEFEYYDVIPLRAPAHQIDTSLPTPPPADDYADGSWTNWMNSPEIETSPYLKSIVVMFQEHTRVTLVRLLRLAPGAVVREHTDPTLGLEIERSVIRLTIPMLNENTEFFLNGTVVPMQPGECWYLRLNDPHRITNPAETERVNMSIDMIPNDWVREMITNAEKEG